MTAIVFQVGGDDAFRDQVLDGPGLGTVTREMPGVTASREMRGPRFGS